MENNNKHLVRVGREFAAAMSDNTPIITIAKMVTELARALDVQTARSEALAAESAATNDRLEKLTQIIKNASNDYCMCGEEMKNRPHGGCGHPTAMFDYHYNQWLEAGKETPVTDAYLKERGGKC